MKTDYDLAIVGSGFGGSVLAMVARRLGLSVVLLERGSHPRFAIGESTSPLMNLLIEQLALRYDLPRLLPLTTYGAWQRAYPDLTCGLKRGFTYFHQTAGEPYQVKPDRSNQLMVAASPNDTVADTHWLRADVDQFLMQEAVALGTDYMDETTLTAITFADGMAFLEGERRDPSGQGSQREQKIEQKLRIRAKFVVDATGPHGFLSRALRLPTTSFPNYPPTQTLYSHFTGVLRCDTLPDYTTQHNPPYPIDDAALHHVFDGGWMWVLRFNNGVTSAGIAVEDWLAEELQLAEGDAAWQRFLKRFPSIAVQFADAKPIRPLTYAPRVAHRTGIVTGECWALLPSAAGFVDPLFSTGMPLTLLGIERLCRIFETTWGTDAMAARLQEYGETTLSEADATAHFIATCYRGMRRFPLFSAFSMFYFAAASYSEMARRLEQPHRVRRFLASDNVPFAAGLQTCAQHLRCLAALDNADDLPAFTRQVTESIACLNIAGLSDPDKSNWYGVDMNDVIVGASKLGMSSEQIREIVKTAPWAQ